jgi:hypothetical protein
MKLSIHSILERGKMDHKGKKLRPRNFPMWLLNDLFVVASMGEEKYGTYDYLEKDYTVNDHLDAAKRHLMRYEDPHQSDNDHESHVSHLYSVAWRCLVAAYVQKYKPHLDDRYKGENNE